MTPRKTPAPVANLREAKKTQAAMRQAESETKQRHPSARKPAAAKAPAKTPAKKTAKPEGEKLTYSATARCGKTNTRASATPLVAALDVKIAGTKNPAWSAGVIVGFYASLEAAQKAADEINGGGAGDGWSDAVVVAAAPVKAAS